ncbi:unnamed protein product [Leuciscus chuanchicus]
MLICVTVLILNVWAISADDELSVNINILEELRKIKTMETKMKSMEIELEKMKTMETKMKSMEIELEKMKTMETKIKPMETELERLGTENKERVKVAFSATLSALENAHKFIGPYATATSLVYENALTNIGNAYDTNTGIFTAPVKGVYYFNFVLFNHHVMSTGLRMLKNGHHVVSATDNPPGQDTEDTASNAVCLLLEEGDRINLQLWENCRVYTDGNRRNTFSGHLLFTM